MIRPFTLLCFCAFAAAGAWLYQVKHAVAMKDRELVEIRRETEQARQRIDILRAEWALLNEPERLRQTATRVLTLEPMQPQHFARATDIERRLPAPVVFAGAPDLFAPAPVRASTPEAPRAPQAAVMLASVSAPAPATRAAASPAPAQPAAAPAVRAPETPEPQALAAAVAQQRAESARRSEQAARTAAIAPRPAPRQAPAAETPRPIQPALHIAPAPARAAPVTRVTRNSAPETTVVSALGAASMLGATSSLGRPTLAPPVPVSQAAAATLGGRGSGMPVPMR
jgi:hypothetical protein